MRKLFSSLENFSSQTAIVDDRGVFHSYSDLVTIAEDQMGPLFAQRGLIVIEAENDLYSVAALVGACRANCPVLLVGRGDFASKPNLRRDFSPDYTFLKTNGSWKLSRIKNPTEIDLHPDLAILLSTSGSTGSSKQVRLSHENLSSNAIAIAKYLDLQPTDRAATVLQFNYSFGLSIVTSHLLSGASIALTNKSVLDIDFWEFFENAEATSFSGVPRTYEILAGSGFLEKRIRGLRSFTQAGGKLRPELIQAFSQYGSQNNAKFFVMYGQTEAAPRISYLPPEMAFDNSDSIGIPVPGGQLDIYDEHNRVVESSGIPGELVYSGPNVMMGYASQRSHLIHEKNTFELRTGDIAEKKENGLFRIIGRASRFVKVAGLRIGLDDVERYVRDYGLENLTTGTDEGLVIAINDSKYDCKQLEQKLIDHFKIPPLSVSVIFDAELPYLPTGKPDYRTVLEREKIVRKVASTDTLEDKFKRLLNVDDLNAEDNFLSSGGDSLSYIEAAKLVEKEYAGPVPGWENLPFKTLFDYQLVSTNGSTPRIELPQQNFDFLVITRSLAILLAMASHAFIKYGAWDYVPEVVRLVTRAATPCFLIVFGLGLSRSYFNKAVGKDFKGLTLRLAPKAITMYTAFFLIVVSSLAWGVLSPYEVGKALLFSRSAGYADILMMYFSLYLIAPFIIWFVAKTEIVGILVLFTLPWLIGGLLNDIQGAPYFVSYLVGTNNVVGPSVLHSICFVTFGYVLGAYSMRSYMKYGAWLVVFISVSLLFFYITAVGFDSFRSDISTMKLRAENSPIYFLYGIVAMSVIVLLALGLAKVSKRNLFWSVLFGMGANTIFSYAIGNTILNLIPALNFLPGPIQAFQSLIFLILLSLLTYDVNQVRPRFFGHVTSLFQRLNTTVFSRRF